MDLLDFFLNFWHFRDCWIFLEVGDGVFSFGIFAIVKCCCVLWNLCCREFESTRHLNNFQNNSKSATLNPLGLEFWECGSVKCCFVLWNLYCSKRLENPRQFKTLNLCLSLFAYTTCVCVIFFELVELVGSSQKTCFGSFHR